MIYTELANEFRSLFGRLPDRRIVGGWSLHVVLHRWHDAELERGGA